MTTQQQFTPVGAEAGTTSARLYQAASAIWAAQLEQPFVQALGNGTLPRANFEFYIRQDARFLEELTRMFAYGAIKSHRPDVMEQMGNLLLNTIRVERELHQGFAREFGLTLEEMENTPLAPTNYAYTRHLLSIGATGSLAEIITSVLPCAWIYAEVGRHFTRLGELPEAHPYKTWLATYSAPGFEDVGAWLRNTLNELTVNASAQELKQLEDIFVTSSRYEYMFWDMAWRKETWPV
ncbi:MAG: transcriptional activator, TenA family [Chloroflexi bacterium]|jgi:thiaminase/transcriptional activator TenA|nr:transcriptional activator, TenA family [Chloroflexota bacterium]